MIRGSTCVLLVLAFIAVGCASPQITITGLRPAFFDEASRIKTVAVLPFDGRDGDDFAKRFEAALSSVRIADRPFFTIVERARLENINDEELKLVQSGFVNVETAARIGMAIGAKGVYTGAINLKTEDVSYTEERERCDHYEKAADTHGRKYRRCAAWVKYPVHCKKRAVTIVMTPRLIEVETGKIAYSQNIVRTSQDSVCGGGNRPLMDAAQLAANVQMEALEAVKASVAPHYVTLTIQLMDSTGGIATGEDRNRLKSGNAFASRNRLDRACELWNEARPRADRSISLLYNLGVCSEAAGDPKAAYELYKKADRLATGPIEAITKALERTDRELKTEERLSEEIK